MHASKKLYDKIESGEFLLLTAREIAMRLRMTKRDVSLIEDILDGYVQEGKLLKDGSRRYGTPEQFDAKKGTLKGNERGFAFFLPDDGTPDLFIPHGALNGAMHADVVFARCTGGKKGDEGEVLSVLERGMTEIVGTFVRDRNAGYLIPDDSKYFENIYIPLRACKNLPVNVKAVAKITSYPFGKAPGGEIIEILGDDDDFFAEERSIIRSYNLRETFPEPVLDEAETVSAKEIDPVGREDFRDRIIVTIDGEDTRDIDDAVEVSFDGTRYTLGVHIADVTEYVKRKGKLDREALERGTSVYFPDRVLPMLPKELSNGCCSLNEGVDRLTLSCIMMIDKSGAVVSKQVCRSVIRSAHRMTYREVDLILNGDGQMREKFKDAVPMLETAKELTLLLQERRRARGNVALDVKEAKILFVGDEISIPDYEHLFSHGLIEQFMVLANESVAALMTEAEMPFIYRIHEKPNPEKAESFLSFARECGLTIDHTAEVTPKFYQSILERAKPLPVYSVLNRVMLRSMQKAKYSPLNVGHFGLASDCYCHFTSPIRRYPDLCVHRVVKAYLDGDEHMKQALSYFVSEAAERSSECERNATEAEREVDALYIVQYMADHIGEEFDAIVSGVTSFGVFAELPNTVEGMIPFETLPNDDYTFIEEKFLLQGKKHAFRLGDELRVRVAGCHFDTYRVEFSLVTKK